MPRFEAQAAEGALGHALPKSGPGQPGQQVGGPAVHVLGLVAERGFEQWLIIQAQARGPSARTDRNMTRSRAAASQFAAISSRAASGSLARSAAR